MTEQEMIEYLRSTRLYEEHEDFFYEKEMINTNKTVPISDLIERFIEIDKEWLQLLPLYIAGELYKDDDLTLSTIYLNEFNNILGILSSKNNSNQTTPLYRMD